MKSKEQRQKEARQRRCKDYWYWYSLDVHTILSLREYREQPTYGVVTFKEMKMKSAERDIENLNRKLGTVGLN